MERTTIGVDLAKSVFEVAVSRRPGHVSERHRLSRARFVQFFAERSPATVLLEACGSAHYWARRLEGMGHSVKLLPPHLVRAYVQCNKTDRSDAKALLEAYRNEEIRPVPVKSVDQHTLAALHRLRSGWMTTRTARVNSLRGILREFGIVIPLGPRHVVRTVGALLEDADSGIPDALRPALATAASEVREIEARILTVERQLRSLARQTPAVERLMSIPGVGLLTATALVAFVGDVRRFPSGRHFASYLGLTPREHSSGSVHRLGRISKRGDAYLRMLLIHGARAVLWAAQQKTHPGRLQAWALGVSLLRGPNKAAVALANKLARIAWAVWRTDRSFEQRHAA